METHEVGDGWRLIQQTLISSNKDVHFRSRSLCQVPNVRLLTGILARQDLLQSVDAVFNSVRGSLNLRKTLNSCSVLIPNSCIDISVYLD